jgi:tetratricopeptide (TPR) repeat protein
MSTERIKQLHEQASERYLGGDYQGALQAWRDVLRLDPADEQALDGTNLASQFVEHGSPAPQETTSEVEHDLDRGLRVLDGLGATTLLHPDGEDGTIDRQPAPRGVGKPETEEFLEGWQTPTPPSAEENSFGLEPLSRSSPVPSTPVSAAGAELSRRVNDLLTDAKAKAEAGERDEALAILFRLAILDEDNAEAAALRSKIESAGASDLDKVERAIIEGVAALGADNLDDAERFFREALELAPQHREAQHYLEKVTERRSQGGEELLSPGAGETAPVENAVERATVIETAPHQRAPSSKPPRPASPPALEPQEPLLGTSGPRSVMRPSKILLWGGGGVLALVCTAVALPQLVGREAQETAPRKTSGPVSRNSKAADPGPISKRKAAAPTRVASSDPQETAKVVASGLARGRALMASQDFGGAVVAFNEALTLDPKNVEARAGIEDAGERYKAGKVERDALNSIRLAFRDGEFTSGLRLAYRLPPSVSNSYADAVKFAGWYNLAVVALRAGDCREALSHLDEALEIAPLEDDAKKLREFASRYVDAAKDRVFLDRVEALAFRSLPSS